MKLKKRFKKLILASESKNLYTTSRLIEEASAQKCPIHWINPFEEQLFIDSGALRFDQSGTFYLNRISGTRLDDFDFLVAEHYKTLGAKVSNPISGHRIFRDKDRANLFLAKHHLSPIPSFTFRGKIPIENIYKSIEGEKFVLKMFRGNQGIGVNLIESKRSLYSLLETFKSMQDQKMIIQPFLEHKSEFRVFVCMGKVLAVVEKNIDQNDFRANAKRSKLKIHQKVPKKLLCRIEHCLETIPLHYYGIDIMIHQDEVYVIEVNPVPGFEYIEKLSKINIAKNLIENLME